MESLEFGGEFFGEELTSLSEIFGPRRVTVSSPRNRQLGRGRKEKERFHPAPAPQRHSTAERPVRSTVSSEQVGRTGTPCSESAACALQSASDPLLQS